MSANPFKPRHPDGTVIEGNEDVDVTDSRQVDDRVTAVREAILALRKALAQPPGGSALHLGACLAEVGVVTGLLIAVQLLQIMNLN